MKFGSLESRNQSLHKGSQIDIQAAITNIQGKFAEFSTLFLAEKPPVPHLAQVASQLSQTPPPPPPKEWIKVNKYIAISDKAAAVAVIPCNYKGEVLKV